MQSMTSYELADQRDQVVSEYLQSLLSDSGGVERIIQAKHSLRSYILEERDSAGRVLIPVNHALHSLAKHLPEPLPDVREYQRRLYARGQPSLTPIPEGFQLTRTVHRRIRKKNTRLGKLAAKYNNV